MAEKKDDSMAALTVEKMVEKKAVLRACPWAALAGSWAGSLA